ncbi:MAG: DUF349 domain-containing protein [Draconibacterium sp.]|nr:DUF349 domain-containing protein [Draconibacterium sp.]
MEPNDLKNSEELKSTKKSNLENSENNIVSEEVEKVEELPQTEDNTTDLADEPVKEKEVIEPEKKVEEEVIVEEKKVEETGDETVEETESTPLEAEETTDISTLVVEDKKEVETETATEETVSNSTKKEEKTEEEKVVAPKHKKPIVKKRETIDYTNFSQIELVNALRDVLENNESHNIKDEVEAIKSVFYKNLNENTENAKKIFIEEDGVEEDFVAAKDPYENDIKDLLRRYRQIRIDFNKKMEYEKDDNLKLKYEVIERIKGLINSEESINKTFNDFRYLQDEWRRIGLVPQSKMKNLWDTYHFHVENFYDYIKINRELRDLDLRKNLEIKIKLCENAEELLIEPSIIKAFNNLQKFHEQWREVGPVPREQKDNIWERFKASTSIINKKHQDFFESRKDEQKKNLNAKTALCEKVEEISISEISSYRDWDEKSKELVELQKVWRTIGFAPKKDNNKIYERFRTACDKFFDAKRDFYAKNKEIQQNNMQLKIDLCVQAEALKDNDDWKKTTQDFINIQKKWKEIGPIPRKHSDNVWKRFRAACDLFFDKKSEHFSGMDNEQDENLKKKEELIEQANNFKSVGNVDDNLKSLKDFQRQWTEVGHVPFKKKDEVQVKFREAINKLFDELNIDDEKRNLLKFRSKMSSYSESNRGQNKMRMERDKYMNKLKQLENDHVLLDNNIGFFAKSKNADALIADIKKKLELSKQKIEFLKNKIRVIDEMDNE